MITYLKSKEENVFIKIDERDINVISIEDGKTRNDFYVKVPNSVIKTYKKTMTLITEEHYNEIREVLGDGRCCASPENIEQINIKHKLSIIEKFKLWTKQK